MRKKKFIAKKQKYLKIKFWCLGLLFVLLFILTIHSLTKVNIAISNEEFLKNIIYHSNHNIPYDYDKKTILNRVVKFFSNINLANPISILDNTYSGLVTSNIDADSDALVEIDEMKANSDYISDPFPANQSQEPIVYIYNTHQLEEYSASNLAEYNVRPNVMMASYILREKLNNYGIASMVEEGNVSDVLYVNGLNYASSYKVSKMFMQSAIENNPSLSYFIDVHRDSVDRTITFKTIGDKNYARILFIVGMENPSYEANLQLTTQLNNRLDEKYPGLSRGIYKKEGPGVDGVYNQDMSPNVILAEMGGKDNTIDEVLNATEALADVFQDYLKTHS